MSPRGVGQVMYQDGVDPMLRVAIRAHCYQRHQHVLFLLVLANNHNYLKNIDIIFKLKFNMPGHTSNYLNIK
jgi:hypothetical protein